MLFKWTDIEMYNFEIPSISIISNISIEISMEQLKKNEHFFFCKRGLPHILWDTRLPCLIFNAQDVFYVTQQYNIQVGRTGVSVQNSKQVFQSLHRGPTFTNLTKNQHPTKPQGHFNCVVVLWLDSLCVHYHIIFIM